LFERRVIHKEYLAIVAGVPQRDSDYIERTIGFHPTQREKMAIRLPEDGGKAAATFYEVIERFEGYASRTEEPNGFVGRKTAFLDQIDFIPVPEDSVRAEGVGTGEYHFGEQLTPDVYANLKANPQVEPVIARPYQFNVVHFNKKQGMFADVRMRKAIRSALDMTAPWKAAWGNEMFYRMDPGISARETAWFSEVGKDSYNNPKPDEAKALLKDAGYKGQPIKWLTTKALKFW
jgi:peptide/nickel transport system substrate-binding protein